MPQPPAGDAPVFPVLVLPEVVLFPRVTMPVYLFEEREMALLEDLLKKKGPSRQGRPLLVVSLCQWDSPYPQEARPQPVGTLAE
ncbi:MAG: LON peptidase substrate-binding domain-containing protein, partial [Bdellovibrionota bacterium]